MTDQEFYEILNRIWPNVGEESEEEFDARLDRWLMDEDDLDEDEDYSEEEED